ncbi:mitochondrial ribosomal protein S25 [Jimgerdemannia flammicorona]|uniref:Small ribosomal subunit protein mS23 n=1 Tax=Jimgerdemannia flammicorona TaxID=994334 RepID=A0A433A3B2_9FUNG|nr:mitochondrial ribosomal protein S25 [Jimgerdemannia flammicorona]
MAFPPAPIKLLKHVTTLLNGGLLKQKPIWYPVLQLIPPGPSIIHTPNPEPNLAGQTPEELLLEQFHPPTRPTSLRHQQQHLRTRPPRPRKIVYPEDRLRRQFYCDHPFELQRPVDLNLNEKGVTGETIIQHQLYLMINEKMPERKAYVQATANFYQIRE